MNLWVVTTLYIYSEIFEHVVHSLVSMCSAGFHVIDGFVESASLFLGRLGNAHAFYRIEDFLQMRQNGFVFNVECEPCHSL